MSRDRTSQRDINSKERQNLALSLRKAGATLEHIRVQCGYGSRSSVHKAIRAALDALPKENAQELRALEVARLDDLLLAYWQRAKKDIGVAHLVLKIAERRSRLLGLDLEPETRDSGHFVVVREVPAGYLDVVTGETIEKLPGDGIVRDYGVSTERV